MILVKDFIYLWVLVRVFVASTNTKSFTTSHERRKETKALENDHPVSIEKGILYHLLGGQQATPSHPAINHYHQRHHTSHHDDGEYYEERKYHVAPEHVFEGQQQPLGRPDAARSHPAHLHATHGPYQKICHCPHSSKADTGGTAHVSPYSGHEVTPYQSHRAGHQHGYNREVVYPPDVPVKKQYTSSREDARSCADRQRASNRQSSRKEETHSHEDPEKKGQHVDREVYGGHTRRQHSSEGPSSKSGEDDGEMKTGKNGSKRNKYKRIHKIKHFIVRQTHHLDREKKCLGHGPGEHDGN